MTVGRQRWGVAVVLLVILAGCGRQAPAPQAEEAKKPESTQAEEAKQPASPAVAVDPKLTRTFAEATRSEPPADWPPPPDMTITGKSTGKLYTEVTKAWDAVKFVNDEGKRIVYTATLSTDLGNIEMELRPDWAPNHVRNFVVLARLGYYDGLLFERIIQQQSDPSVADGVKVHIIEAGCPLGTGELGQGSIGYWLKPEFDEKVKHEEGTVGACRGEEPDTGACRFYITLCKCPILDGNYTAFARITGGLDVARKIFSSPVRVNEDDTEGDHRPEKPTVIRKVEIKTKVVDKQGAGGDN